VFLVFARLPGGRTATLAYFKKLAEMPPLFVCMQEPGWQQPMDVWNPQVPQFPVGTEFALVRKMVLPDREGRLRLTPVTESVQIRHHTDIPNVDPMASRDVALAQRFQEPSEIDLSRVLLFRTPQRSPRGHRDRRPFSNPSRYVAGFRCLRGTTHVGALCFGVRRMQELPSRTRHSIHDELLVSREPRRRSGAKPASRGNHAEYMEGF
jgi:hypothetical protein